MIMESHEKNIDPGRLNSVLAWMGVLLSFLPVVLYLSIMDYTHPFQCRLKQFVSARRVTILLRKKLCVCVCVCITVGKYI